MAIAKQRRIGRGCRTTVVMVENGTKVRERKSADSERHVQTALATKVEPGHVCSMSGFWFRTLSLRSWWMFSTRISAARATSSVKRNNLVTAYSSFTNRAHLSTGSCFQPCVKARPTKQMPAVADNCVCSCIKTDITFKLT